MSKGYIIFTVAIRDQAGFDGYVEKVVPIVGQYGGQPIIVEDNADVIEGKWHGNRTVVLEFDSVSAAHAWYESPEYKAIRGERHASTETNAVIVGGFEMPTG